MSDEVVDRLVAAAPGAALLLDEPSRARYRAHAERLVRRTSWEAARGFTITDEIVAAIAAHAALLVAGFEPRTEPFRDVTSVIVHGGTIVNRDIVPGPARGVVSNAPRYLAGQAGHGRGPIVLDWRTARVEIAHPERGVNVIYHEFAHKLDQLDGTFDGAPPLGSDRARPNGSRRSAPTTGGSSGGVPIRSCAPTEPPTRPSTSPSPASCSSRSRPHCVPSTPASTRGWPSSTDRIQPHRSDAFTPVAAPYSGVR